MIGEAGLLVGADDPTAWRDAALKLYRDEVLRKRLSEHGRERALRYCFARLRIAGVVARAVSRHRRKARFRFAGLGFDRSGFAPEG